jgi:hypothetical protein
VVAWDIPFFGFWPCHDRKRLIVYERGEDSGQFARSQNVFEDAPISRCRRKVLVILRHPRARPPIMRQYLFVADKADFREVGEGLRAERQAVGELGDLLMRRSPSDHLNAAHLDRVEADICTREPCSKLAEGALSGVHAQELDHLVKVLG